MFWKHCVYIIIIKKVESLKFHQFPWFFIKVLHLTTFGFTINYSVNVYLTMKERSIFGYVETDVSFDFFIGIVVFLISFFFQFKFILCTIHINILHFVSFYFFAFLCSEMFNIRWVKHSISKQSSTFSCYFIK